MESSGIPVEVVRVTTHTKSQLELGLSSGEILRLDPIPVEALEMPLLFCAPALALALAKTDEVDMAGLTELIRSERATLVVEWLGDEPQGCAVTMLTDYPLFRAGTILAIAGFPGKRTRYPNADSLELLRRWFKHAGCTKIEGFAKESVARLWSRIGFKEVSRLVRMDI